jgi:hypothetical protein
MAKGFKDMRKANKMLVREEKEGAHENREWQGPQCIEGT